MKQNDEKKTAYDELVKKVNTIQIYKMTYLPEPYSYKKK